MLADRAVDPRDHPPSVQAEGLRAQRLRRPADDRIPVRRHPGTQSEPGLIVFRYDAELFYANANRFVDDVEALVEHAPDPVRWLILDAGAIDDIDYSAGLSLSGLCDFLDARGITLALARPDAALLDVLQVYELKHRFPDSRIFPTMNEAIAAFRAGAPTASRPDALRPHPPHAPPPAARASVGIRRPRVLRAART